MRRCEEECYGIAAQLRLRIAELLGGGPADEIILCPGILMGMQALFSGLGIKRVASGPEEYYGQDHMPHLMVEAFPVDQLISRVVERRPDAVLLSVVTWRGRVVPLADIFRELRQTLKDEAPLLVADYSHGGAAGFPPIAELNADIVCGDPLKWIAGPDEETRMAFLRIGNGDLVARAKRIFRPFFLATSEHQYQLFARWLDPREIEGAVARFAELDRAALVSRHTENMSLAEQLALKLGLSEKVQSSILWLDDERRLPDWLKRGECVWMPPGGGARVLCRADNRALCQADTKEAGR